MLKHCHATSFDQTRRSRRNIAFSNNVDQNINNTNKNNANSNGNTIENNSLNVSTISNNPHDSSFKCPTPSNGLSASTSFLTLNSIAQQKYSSLQRDDSRRSSYSTLEPLSITSRTSSFASLNNVGGQHDAMKRTPIKIYAKCLRADIEYKTLSISRHTTSTEVIWMLLSKFKMRHRDPKLFYLTMDIGIISHGCPSTVSGAGGDDSFTRTLVLEDDAYPAELKSCHPWGECRFTLQTRKGGLVRIHDSVLMEESKYKCLLISDMTTVNEVISILFHCYGLERIERVDRYELWEQSQQPVSGYERCLQPSDCPVNVQSSWQIPSQYKFVLRRNCKAFQTSTPLSTNSSALSVTTSSSSLSSPRSSSVSPCSSTSSSAATTENMSVSLSPSSTNGSEVYSANDSDVIVEEDEEAMDTSYSNSYSPLSIQSIRRSSPSGASSSSTSTSPTGSIFTPNVFSSYTASSNEVASRISAGGQSSVFQTKPHQYPPPLPPPPKPNAFPAPLTATTTRSNSQNAPVCLSDLSSHNPTTPNNMSMTRSQYFSNGYSQSITTKSIQNQQRGIYETTKWNKGNTITPPTQSDPRHPQQPFNAGQQNQNNTTLPKTNFNLNGPVSRIYPNMSGPIRANTRLVRQQQGRPSIHESGLPSLRPKPMHPYSDTPNQMQQQQFSSLNYRSTNLTRYQDQRNRIEGRNPFVSLNGVDIKNNQVAFHEYENYFYI